MRAVAISVVVIAHGLPILGAANTGFPWVPLFDGVDMFFVLSGYLIGGILINVFVVPGEVGFRELFTFLRRRWFRTLPNYYLVLPLNAVLACLQWNMGIWGFVSWKFAFFTQNLAWPFDGFFGESWSLAVEEWFYMSFPLALLAAGFWIRKAEHRKYLFLVAAMMFACLPLILRIMRFSPLLIDSHLVDIGVRKVVAYRLDAIAYGLIMVFLARHAPGFWKTARWPLFAFGTVLFLFIIAHKEPPASRFSQIWVYALSPLAYAAWLPLLSQLKTAPRWLLLPVRHISLVSYSMYLVHLGLISEVIRTCFLPDTVSGAWLMFMAYLFIVLGTSTVLYRAWEKPMMDLRDRA